MANLLSNTTVGGSAVITTSNIGTYALTSIPTSFSNITVTSSFNTASNDVYASMRVIRNDSAITDGMYIGYGNSGSGITRIFGGGVTTGALEKYATYTVEPGSFRAPIFYDSADTSYYLDLNSTSYLYHLVLSGNSYFRPNSWIEFNGNYGLYWPNNYALHLYPNNSGSYGALQIDGTKGGWAGIHFNSSANTLMANANESGFHRQGNGWQFRWTEGTMYVHRSTNGGGTAHTVLDTGNYNSFSIPTKQYVWSRGENLLTNGTGLLGNNTNFSSFTFDGSQAYFSSGSFRYTGQYNSPNTDELMPVNPEKRYRLDFWAKTANGQGAYYAYLNFFDVDGNSIMAPFHMYYANTLTTLAQTLNPGDTVAYLTSVANWENGGTAGVSTHIRSFIFWNYTNSFGYTYPPQTYSRNWYSDAWNPGAINSGNNTITLRVPWSGPSIAAGTQVSNGSAGGTFKYIALGYTIVPTTWTNYVGIMDGVDYSGTNAGGKFPPGTAAAKLGFLTDYNASGDTIYLANLFVGVDNDYPIYDRWTGNTRIEKAGAFYGTIFYDSNDSSFYLNPNGTSRLSTLNTTGSITTDGYLYTNSSTRIGEIWGYGGVYKSSGEMMFGTEGYGWRWHSGNVQKAFLSSDGFFTTAGGIRVGSGDLYLDQNYGRSVVGVYSSYRYQGVWAMGDSYKLSADGTSTGNLYGLAWSHPDTGGQTKAGLEHQLLVMNYGVTQTAIGTGIWTSGLITTSSYGTSANWKAAYDWGNHASAGYVTSSALSSYVPLSGTTLTEGNYFYFRSNRGAYLGALDSPSLQVYATGSNAAFMSFHRGGNYAVNFGLDADNIMRIGGWSAGADRWVLDMSGNNTVAGSFRAPIFYDSANTNFYGDFASTSVMNSIRFGTSTNNGTLSGVSDWGVTLTTDNGWIRFGPANSSWAHIYASQAFYFNQDLHVNGNIVITSATIGSQSVSYASTAGSLSSMNISQFTNNSGYITGISFANVSSKPTTISGYGITDAITTANIGSQSVSYAATAGSAPANGGNSSTVGGYSVSVGASANTIPTRNSSGYLIPESWIQLNGIYGLYSPTNGAHLRPNDGSYGSWMMTGSRNSWQGIEFNSGNSGNVTLMINVSSNTVGFHNNSYGWQFLWESGTLYCFKNAYGGGTQATVLDSSNYSSWAQPIASAINTGNIGSQSVSYASSAGSVAWTNVSSRPTALSQFSNDLGNYGGWLTTGGKAADSELIDGIDSSRIIYGDGSLGSTNYSDMNNTAQKSGFFFYNQPTGNPFGDWTHWINCMGNSWNPNYGFQLAHAFHSNNFAVRVVANGGFSSWRTIIDSGNIGSQSVSYASSAGSASTAGSATTAQQLTKFGDIYGQDWNSYYVSGKLIVSNALGHSGANRPNLTYDYGVALSYGETGGPLLQMYFPENSGNIGTIFRKGTYRTGWNGNWSTWKTLVEQEGNLCTIVGGNGTGLEVHGNVGYNQDPLTYFLIRGQADTSWKALKIRLTGDAGGQDIEFRRIAENGTDSRMWYVPRGANTVNFDYPIVQPSDSRLKDNITPISTPVDKIKSLRGVEFDWNSGEQVGTHDVGLIAQDVEAVLPEAVTTQEDGYKNLAYTKVIPLLVEAMKEQQAMIDALKAEIELLKNK